MELNMSDVFGPNSSNIKIRDPERLTTKLRKMIEDGKDNLQVVADFDCTLTRQRAKDGNKLLTSFGMFNECPSVPAEYKNEDVRLCQKYKPIEVDPTLSNEEKSKHMVDWYKQANGLLKGFPYPKEELNVVAQLVTKNLRDGVQDMFTKLNIGEVPVLVFSAGLGNAVLQVLKCADLYKSNVKVISNFLNIDQDGMINGVIGDVIHTFNKNETVIKHTEYYDMIKNRSNVILLGDTIGDAGMAEGIEHSEAVVKIGYLFHNIEGNLPLYMDAFDIVLIDDQTVDVTNKILNLIIK